ncbi:hypothetical protein BH10PLA1_BH10PLA1_11650 [soil metagenome]
MKSLLHTLHDNESILLLYLFDELPADDRAEVEGMLAADANLRSQLDQLREANDVVNAALERADTVRAHGVSPVVAQRQAAKAIDQWSTRQVLSHAREKTGVQPRKRKWLTYSSGVAAAILAGLLIYRGMSSDSVDKVSSSKGVVAWNTWSAREREVLDLFPAPVSDAAADPTIALAQSPGTIEMLQRSLDPSEEILNDSLKHANLVAAERELSAVAQLGDPNAINGGVNFQ